MTIESIRTVLALMSTGETRTFGPADAPWRAKVTMTEAGLWAVTGDPGDSVAVALSMESAARFVQSTLDAAAAAAEATLRLRRVDGKATILLVVGTDPYGHPLLAPDIPWADAHLPTAGRADDEWELVSGYCGRSSLDEFALVLAWRGTVAPSACDRVSRLLGWPPYKRYDLADALDIAEHAARKGLALASKVCVAGKE